jgi:carboxyl-terminal processing protease
MIIKDTDGKKYIKISVKKTLLAIIFFLISCSLFISYQIKNENYNQINLNRLMSFLKANHISEVKDKELYKNAMRGMVHGLDKYSYTITGKENPLDYNKKIIGIGIQVSEVKEGILIDKIYKESSLNNSNVKSGDIITSINKKTYNGEFNDFKKELAGEEGDKRILVIKSKNKTFEHTVTLVPFKITYVDSKIIQDDYLYVKIHEFTDTISNDVHNVYQNELKAHGGLFKGIIFDVRNNPGGVFTEALKLLDLFVNKNDKIAITNKYKNNHNETYVIGEVDITENTPMIVLVNKRSASASEIFSGVLQYFGRAKIIGEQTYGKGVGQGVFEFNDDMKMALTTFEYYINKNIKVNEVGITPDIIIKNDISVDDKLTEFFI